MGHAWRVPVRWNCEVNVFGRKVNPGDLIHADKHGFLVIPDEDQDRLLDAARFMDSNECKTVIPSARGSWNKTPQEMLADFDRASAEFKKAIIEKFGKKGA